MTYYRNVYERPDGTQFIGHGWRSRTMADQVVWMVSDGVRRIFVLRITERVR